MPEPQRRSSERREAEAQPQTALEVSRSGFGTEASTSEAESSESPLIRRPRRSIMIEEATEEEMVSRRQPKVKDLSLLAFDGSGSTRRIPQCTPPPVADRARTPPPHPASRQQFGGATVEKAAKLEKRPRTEPVVEVAPGPIVVSPLRPASWRPSLLVGPGRPVSVEDQVHGNPLVMAALAIACSLPKDKARHREQDDAALAGASM